MQSTSSKTLVPYLRWKIYDVSVRTGNYAFAYFDLHDGVWLVWNGWVFFIRNEWTTEQVADPIIIANESPRLAEIILLIKNIFYVRLFPLQNIQIYRKSALHVVKNIPPVCLLFYTRKNCHIWQGTYTDLTQIWSKIEGIAFGDIWVSILTVGHVTDKQ